MLIHSTTASRVRRPRSFAAAAAAFAPLCLWLGLATAAAGAESMPGMHHAKAPAPACTDLSLQCATAATPFIDPQGKLWLAWTAGGAVSVAQSNDHGHSFSAPVVIGRHGELLDVGADARPQIVVDGKGRIIVTYGVFKDKNYNAQVLIATSTDGGATFSAEHSLSHDAASQRFPTLAVDTGGTLTAAWLDKRTDVQAKENGVVQPGAALAYAVSTDGGVSFDGEKIVADHTCECCRLGLAIDPQHHPVLLFRKIYGERERDHAVLTITGNATADIAHRVAVDHWMIDGCPHHGPSLAVAADGTLHAAWFTLGDARQGLFYAYSNDGGKTFSAPQGVGDVEQQAGRPSLLARGRSVWLAWKEFDGRQIFIKARHSNDAGRTWSADRIVATTSGHADHPLLIADAAHVYVSWLAQDQGYRLLALDEQ